MHALASTRALAVGRPALQQGPRGTTSSSSTTAHAVTTTSRCSSSIRRPPSLLLAHHDAAHHHRPPTVIAAARKSASADAAADGSAAPAPAARKRRASSAKAAAPPPPAEEDDDEPTPAQILAQVTRRIRDHGKAGRIRDAIAELAGLADKGLQPDRLAATALVAACAARPTPQNMTVAEGVFEELFGDGGEGADGNSDGPLLQPDEVTFAVLLRGYGAATPPAWPKIDATLGRMRRSFGIAPTATSYNALLEACVRVGDMDRAMDVVDRMADDGVEPDAQTAQTCARKRALRAYARKALEI